MLYLLYFLCLYFNYINLASFFQKVSDFENLSQLETTVIVKEVSYIDFPSIVYFVESGFLLVLAILYGFVNYSNEPRIKTTCATILVVLGFIGWEAYAYYREVRNIPMLVVLGLSLLSLLYIMVAGMRKSTIITYFKRVKDDIFYEYTYQRLFARPSLFWARRFKVAPEKRRRIWKKDFQKLGAKDKVL